MRTVYEAVDQCLRSRVAVKPTSEDAHHPLKAFEREAQFLSSLRHAAVPVVTGYFAAGGAPFLVMQ
jgi:hypothetical protein